MNIFEVLNRGNSRLKEPSLSAMLGYLLDTRENHGFGNLFLNELLDSLGPEYTKFAKETEHTEVELESKYLYNGAARWIDIELRLLNEKKNESCRILIENKINDGAANENQLREYYDAILFENPDLENLLVLFITPGTTSSKLNGEFDNLVMKNEKHTKKWITWAGNENSIVEILRKILSKESLAQVTPMNEYLKHTIKALIVFVEEIIKPKSAKFDRHEIGGIVDEFQISIDGEEYKLEKYESKTVLGYKDGEKIIAKNVIRIFNKKFNLGYGDEEMTKVLNTRELGNAVIKRLKEMAAAGEIQGT